MVRETKSTDKISVENEIHVTEVLGIPVVRRYSYVERCNGEIYQESSRTMQLMLRGFYLIVVCMLFISFIAALGILYHPPPILHELADTFLMHLNARTGVSEMEELQTRLNQSELEKANMTKTVETCLDEKTILATSFEERKKKFEQLLEEKGSKLRDLDKTVYLLKEEIKRMVNNEKVFTRNENKLEKQMVLIKEQRNECEKKLNDNDQHIKELKKQLLKFDDLKIEFLNLKKNTTEGFQEKENQVDKCKKAQDMVEEKLKESTENEKKLNDKLENLKSRNMEMKEELTKAKSEVEKIPRLNNMLTKLENDIVAERKSKDVLTVKLTENEATLNICLDTNMEYENENKALNKIIGDFEQTVSKLNETLVDEKKEKEGISKELEESKLRFGNCMNKNNDHQVSNANLLGEIEHLKKQLEKC